MNTADVVLNFPPKKLYNSIAVLRSLEVWDNTQSVSEQLPSKKCENREV